MVTSYTFTHSVETDATPEAIWALYEDVSSWPSWDAQAEKITGDGPFEAGTTGTMIGSVSRSCPAALAAA